MGIRFQFEDFIKNSTNLITFWNLFTRHLYPMRFQFLKLLYGAMWEPIHKLTGKDPAPLTQGMVNIKIDFQKH